MLGAINEIIDEHEIVCEDDHLPLRRFIHKSLRDLASPAMVQR